MVMPNKPSSGYVVPTVSSTGLNPVRTVSVPLPHSTNHWVTPAPLKVDAGKSKSGNPSCPKQMADSAGNPGSGSARTDTVCEEVHPAVPPGPVGPPLTVSDTVKDTVPSPSAF